MHSIFRWTTALMLALGMAVTVHADDTVTQIRRYAADHRMLVLGELHGTRETPLLVRQLVDDYSRDRRAGIAGAGTATRRKPHAAPISGFRWRSRGTPAPARPCVLDRAR